MEKRLRSSLQTSPETFLSAAVKTSLRSSKSALQFLLHSLKPSSATAATSLPSALHNSISLAIAAFHDPLQTQSRQQSPASPPSKRIRRTSKPQKTDHHAHPPPPNPNPNPNSNHLLILTHVALLCASNPHNAFSPQELYPAVKLLHDNLMLFESDSALLAEISSLCEEWWKRELWNRETLISLFLPALLSKSLTEKKKVDVHRVYALREAFELFDFEDESIEDLKLLLMRAVIAPVYLKTEEGRKFVAFLFGLSLQLMKDAFAMIKAQIPFGNKTMLDAYGEVLFRAWKGAKRERLEEIENGFVQILVEGAVHASSTSLAASIRRILGAFINQRTAEGVEKLLFRLAEPIIFRSLQVANSNVRLNALHLMLDMFPLEDPDSTKDAKDMLLNRQFYLMDKLLKDECPDVRVVAVEGSCRILHLFWEVIPSSTITKIAIKIMDDMSHDASKDVRLSTVNGLIFLLGNLQSRELLKALLPRIGHLLSDHVLSVRASLVDLLLLLRDIRSFPFNKVVDLDKLLSALITDQPIVAQKVARLLLPSYFPSKVAAKEACARVMTLMKRAPKAGVRFCEFIILEGVSSRSLLQLVSAFIDLVLSSKELDTEHVECLLIGAAHLCKHLAGEASYRASLTKLFAGGKLKTLVSVLSTGRAKSALFNIVSAISLDEATEIVKESIALITQCGGLSEDVERQVEVRSVHKFLLHCDQFDEMLDVVATILHKYALSCQANFGTSITKQTISCATRSKSKSSRDESSRHSLRGKSKKTAAASEKEFAIAAGLAWQIKEMLNLEDTQRALLHSQHLEMIFLALKVISEASLLLADCVLIDSSPVGAYTALAMHMNLKNVRLSGTSSSNHSEASCPQTVLDVTMDHVLCSTEMLLKTLNTGNVNQLSSANLDTGSSQARQVKHLHRVNLLTTVLKFIVDVTSMQLAKCDQERCIDIVLAYIQYVTMLVQKNSQNQHLVKDDDLNATFKCLKSSCTYVLKLLNQIFSGTGESSPPAAEASQLANNLLHLILSVEIYMGSCYASPLVNALKPWVPDLVMAFGYIRILDIELNNSSTASVDDGQHIQWWHSVIAEIELTEVDDKANGDEASTVCKFPVFKKLSSMIADVIHGNSNILDAAGVNLLSSVLVAMDRKEFSTVLGILHFVCGKIAGQHENIWGKLNLMLTAMIKIYSRINEEIHEDGTDEYDRKILLAAKALIKPIWIYYTYENGGERDMED